MMRLLRSLREDILSIPGTRNDVFPDAIHIVLGSVAALLRLPASTHSLIREVNYDRTVLMIIEPGRATASRRCHLAKVDIIA